MTGFDVTACAEDFWKAVGEPEAYPRSLERSICRAFAVFIVKVPNLDVQAVNEHLKQRRLPWEMDVAPRRLRACLLARAGMGWVFLDGADPPDQMRFSLAHEMAHFLLDHLAPRRLALATLGNSILDVLDGRRQPTPAEQLHGLLRDIPLGRFSHFMERDAAGSKPNLETLDAEDRADLLALELLAPLASVRTTLAAQGHRWSHIQAGQIAAVLVSEFGLPASIAASYARHLLARHTPPLTFRQWLTQKSS